MMSRSETLYRDPGRPLADLSAPSPRDDDGQLTSLARRLGRRRLLAFQAVERSDHVSRGDRETRRERARLRAAEARIDYVRALDRLWETGHGDEAIAVFREMRPRG